MTSQIVFCEYRTRDIGFTVGNIRSFSFIETRRFHIEMCGWYPRWAVIGAWVHCVHWDAPLLIQDHFLDYPYVSPAFCTCMLKYGWMSKFDERVQMPWCQFASEPCKSMSNFLSKQQFSIELLLQYLNQMQPKLVIIVFFKNAIQFFSLTRRTFG